MSSFLVTLLHGVGDVQSQPGVDHQADHLLMVRQVLKPHNDTTAGGECLSRNLDGLVQMGRAQSVRRDELLEFGFSSMLSEAPGELVPRWGWMGS